MKYIPAERLKGEIEKRLKNVRDYMTGVGMKYKGPKYFKAQGKESAYDALLNIIESLQQEQPEVDLDKEPVDLDKEIDELFDKKGWGCLEDVSPMEFAHHFYELGLNARKEE